MTLACEKAERPLIGVQVEPTSNWNKHHPGRAPTHIGRKGVTEDHHEFELNISGMDDQQT